MNRRRCAARASSCSVQSWAAASSARRHRAGAVLHQPDHRQVVGPGERLRALLALRRDRRHPEDHPRFGQPGRGLEVLAVAGHRLLRVGRAEVPREREAGPERGGRVPAVQGGAEDPQRRQRYVVRDRPERLERMVVGEAVDVGEQLGELLRELVAAGVDPVAAQGVGGELVRAGCPADPEVDAARVQALQHPEGLGDGERGVVRQHDAAAADPDRAGRGGHGRDHHHRCTARDAADVVVLGEPVALVAERLRGLRQRHRVVQGAGGGPARRDRREVENGQRNGRCRSGHVHPERPTGDGDSPSPARTTRAGPHRLVRARPSAGVPVD